MIPRGTPVIRFLSGMLRAFDPFARFGAGGVLLRGAPDAEIGRSVGPVYLVAPQMQPDLFWIFGQFGRVQVFGEIDAGLDRVHPVAFVDRETAPDFPFSVFFCE